MQQPAYLQRAPAAAADSRQPGPAYNNNISNHSSSNGGNGTMRAARPDTATAGDARDQEQEHELSSLSQLDLPITYMPFKFENRRVRIDWRLLHGVDIDRLVRDTDLDTLEQLVTCVTWGDIEAEDTRHLSEGNFVKVFRLAQLLLEYLLYVQENLKYTNGVLDKSRSTAVLHAQGLSSRCRELYGQLKHCRRELKRAHKTVKTFELMAAAVGGAAAAAQAASAQAAAAAVVVAAPQQEAAAQQQQPQQQQGAVMTAGELMLQSQLTELTERLTLAVCEAERLRSERQELQYQIRHLHDTLAAKLGSNGSIGRSGLGSSTGGSGSRAAATAREAAAEAATAAAVAAAQDKQQQLFMAELQCAQAQIDELHAHNKELRDALQQQSDAAAAAAAAAAAELAASEAAAAKRVAAATAAASAAAAAAAAAEPDDLAALRAQLEEQAQELARLQAELCARDASIKVFETTNAALQAQLEALQRQLASPEATTPSFVAKQRQQLAAAATAHAGLQAENVQLRQELLQLRLAAEAGRTAGGSKDTGAAGGEEEEDTLAAAERLLSDDGDGSSGGGGGGGATARSRDWKVQEIGRLQADNKQLQAKAASLQEALYDLESSNARLEKRLAAAQAAGFVAAAGGGSAAASPQKAAPAPAAAAAEMTAAAGGLSAGASGWASVSSSGPAAELTAADLATGTGAAAAQARLGGSSRDVQLEQSSVESFDAGDGGDDSTGVAAAGKAAAVEGISPAAAGSGSEGIHIPAYRPSRGDTAGGTDPAIAAAGPDPAALKPLRLLQQVSEAASADATHAVDSSSSGGGSSGVNAGAAAPAAAAPAAAARGSIDQAAAQQLRSLVHQLESEHTPEQLSGEYAEVCCDWDKPFDLTDDEKAQFRRRLPGEVTGLRDVLCGAGQQQHSAEEVVAAKPRMLPAINRVLDAQLASYGIHPGRTGLSNTELLAAMKMLSERREALDSALTPEQRSDVEVTRLGLLLHPYHALQATLATLPDGPDGKKHLPAVTPALASAVRPPAGSAAAALPPPPPPIRLQPYLSGGNSPLGFSPKGFGSQSSPGPAAGAVAVVALSGYDATDDSEVHSAGPSPTRQPAALTHLRPPSPLGSEAAREAIAKATAAGSFSPMSAALHAKQQLLGSTHSGDGGSAGSPTASSPGGNGSVSPAGAAGSTGASPLGYYSAKSTAVATKQFTQSAFDADSDDF